MISNKTKHNWHLYALTLTLIAIISLSSAHAIINQTIRIQGSGSIVYLTALNVEGQYLKDDFGNTIYLRGVGHHRYDMDPTGTWALDDEGEAWYSGQQRWNEEALRDNLKEMRRWGCNLLRIHTVADWWLQETVTVGDYTGSYRENLKRTIEIAAEEGIYVLFDLFSPLNYKTAYSNGWSAPCLPYPPYLNHPEEEAVFSSKQDFVDYWADVANELKDYSNVLFELYNEPHAPSGTPYSEVVEIRDDWFDAMQQAITAIRNAGSESIVVVHWLLSTVPYVGWEGPIAGGMQWVEAYNFTDSSGNIMYSAHFYRTYLNAKWYDGYDYSYTLQAMQNMEIDYIINTLNKPVIIGEMGVNLWENDVNVDGTGLTELEKELQWVENVLDISNDWGVSYSVWAWEVVDQWNLLSKEGQMIPGPSEWGQVLIDAIADGGTIVPP